MQEPSKHVESEIGADKPMTPKSKDELAMSNTSQPEDSSTRRCQYAFPGTYGHECGAPATSILVHKRLESSRQALLGLGVDPAELADGLSRVGRCDKHRGIVEFGDGAFVRTEPLSA